MFLWTLLFHVVGLVFWVGGLLVATSIFGQYSDERSPEARTALGQAGTRMLSGMANPGAIITVITGIILVDLRGAEILRTTWLQAKIILVVCLLIMHGIGYVRARKLLTGKLRVPRKSWMVLHGAISLVFFGILICVLPGRLYWK
ncbi:MAG: CopD family protein [Terriglobia bacterium]